MIRQNHLDYMDKVTGKLECYPAELSQAWFRSTLAQINGFTQLGIKHYLQNKIPLVGKISILQTDQLKNLLKECAFVIFISCKDQCLLANI